MNTRDPRRQEELGLSKRRKRVTKGKQTDVQKSALERAAEKLSGDPEKAGKSLPADERKSYRDSQESVVDAKRSATMHEGHLRIS